MKPILLFAALFAAASTVDAQCMPQVRAWLTLEVVAAEPAGDEPVEVIDVDAVGCVTVRYASFDRRAGLYRRQLPPSERAALATLVAQRGLVDFDPAAVRAAIKASDARLRLGLDTGLAARSQVDCGDTYRLLLDDPSGAARIEWYAPKQQARRHRDITALADLVGVIEALQALAADERRTRIAAVAP